MKIARVYIRVSTEEQTVERQERLIEETRRAGCYVAGVYRETASGATMDRPELQRMLYDLQPGEIVVAERVDRLTRLPLPEAEALVATIRERGARLSIPGLVDLAPLVAESDGVARVVLAAVQDLILRLALQMARDDYETRRERQAQGIALAQQSGGKYEGRKRNHRLHGEIINRRKQGRTIAETATLCGCSQATVKNAVRLWREECPREYKRWKAAQTEA